MKKVILSITIAFVVLVVSSYGVYQSVYNVPQPPDVTLANVEALAGGEGGDLFSDCWVRELRASQDYVIYANMKKRFLSSNCKVKCGYTCRIQISSWYPQ